MYSDKENKLLILNDQGGGVMSVSEDITATLRAQDHGHPPLIVFEPGAASRVGGHIYTDDVSGSLRAKAGDNQQAICYKVNRNDIPKD